MSNSRIQSLDKKSSVQMLAFSITGIIVILMIISFVRINVAQQEQIRRQLKIESALLEAVIVSHLDYAKYFVKIIGIMVKKTPHDLERIKQILQDHLQHRDFNDLFGWRKYSWVNSSFQTAVTSTKGIVKKTKRVDRVRSALFNAQSNDWNRLFKFSTYMSTKHGSSLQLIHNLFGDVSHRYLGSLVLTCNIDTMIHNLNNNKKIQM